MKTFLTSLIILIAWVSSQCQFASYNPTVDSLFEYDEFNPTLGSAVVGHKKLDINFFNDLSTRVLRTTQIMGEDTLIRINRQTVLTDILQLNYGLAKNQRFNIGLEGHFVHNRLDNEPDGSVLNVFSKNSEIGSSVRVLGAVGPRIRFIPFTYVPELIIQSDILFPIANGLSRQRQIGWDRIRWFSQGSFYQHIFPRATFQLQFNYGLYFKNTNRQQTTHEPGFNTFFIYQILTEKLYFLIGITYSTQLENTFRTALKQISYTTLATGGATFQPNRDLSILVGYQRPLSHQLGSIITVVENNQWWSLILGVRFVI